MDGPIVAFQKPRANPDLDSRTPIFKTDPVLKGYQSALRGCGTSKVGLQGLIITTKYAPETLILGE